LICATFSFFQDYKSIGGSGTIRQTIRRTNSTLSFRTPTTSHERSTDLSSVRNQATRSPSSRQSSSDPAFSFIHPKLAATDSSLIHHPKHPPPPPPTKPKLDIRTRHASANYPASRKQEAYNKQQRSTIEPFPVRLKSSSSSLLTEEPVPVFRYSSSDEANTPPPPLNRIRKRKPRNALKLERPSMDSFNPLQTSEKIDRTTRNKKTVSCSDESLITLQTHRARISPPPVSPRKESLIPDFNLPSPTQSRNSSAIKDFILGNGVVPLTGSQESGGPRDMSLALHKLEEKTNSLSKLYQDLEEDTRTNTRDIGNLQESIVKVATTRDIKLTLDRVGGETSTLIAELQATQRNVMKCLSEAEQARRDYDELKMKTESILHQLQQCQLLSECGGGVPVNLSSRISLSPASSSPDTNKDRTI